MRYLHDLGDGPCQVKYPERGRISVMKVNIVSVHLS